MKPYLSIPTSFAKDNIKPAFFPSAVSIGHNRPYWLG